MRVKSISSKLINLILHDLVTQNKEEKRKKKKKLVYFFYSLSITKKNLSKEIFKNFEFSHMYFKKS